MLKVLTGSLTESLQQKGEGLLNLISVMGISGGFLLPATHRSPPKGLKP